jgi:hypothetical protein
MNDIFVGWKEECDIIDKAKYYGPKFSMNVVHFDFYQMHPLCVFQDLKEFLPGIGSVGGIMQGFDKMCIVHALA